MSGNWIDRLAGVKRRKEAREKSEEIRQKKERYRSRAESLKGVLDSLANERARAAELQRAGCAVPEPDFSGVASALKRELEKKFHEFDLQAILRPWDAKSREWARRLDEGQRSVVGALPGADLEQAVLLTLRRHFAEVIDGISDRASARKSLLREEGLGSLTKLKELHDADMEAVQQLAGAHASDDWKAALLRLVSAEGITWTDLEQGPLRDWLEEYELLRHCRVRLR